MDRERRTDGTVQESIGSPATVARDSVTNLQHEAQAGSKMHANEHHELPKEDSQPNTSQDWDESALHDSDNNGRLELRLKDEVRSPLSNRSGIANTMAAQVRGAGSSRRPIEIATQLGHSTDGTTSGNPP